MASFRRQLPDAGRVEFHRFGATHECMTHETMEVGSVGVGVGEGDTRSGRWTVRLALVDGRHHTRAQGESDSEPKGPARRIELIAQHWTESL